MSIFPETSLALKVDGDLQGISTTTPADDDLNKNLKVKLV